jgi:hypothetical protein
VADRRIARRLGIVFFLLFALFHRGHFSGTDELGLYQVTASMYSHGSLAVPDFVHTAEGVDGRRYSHFSVGQSALAVPFYALGRLASALLPEPARAALAGPHLSLDLAAGGGRVEIFAVGLYAPAAAALLVALFFAFERRLGVSTGTAVACAALFGATSYVATHATFFLRHVSECLCIVGALYFYLAWKQDGRTRDLWLGSAIAAALPLVRLPASIAGPALAGYLGWCLYQRSGHRLDAALLKRALPAILVPLGVGLALSAASDQARWGVPWNVNQLGTASAGSTPLYKSLYGALLSPGMSVFVYSPLLLLTPWTFPLLWRRYRAEAVAFAAICLGFLIVFSSFIGWTGLWSAPGPRYQLISTPLLLLPLGLWLEADVSRRRLAQVVLPVHPGPEPPARCAALPGKRSHAPGPVAVAAGERLARSRAGPRRRTGHLRGLVRTARRRERRAVAGDTQHRHEAGGLSGSPPASADSGSTSRPESLTGL